jgi:DUF917 family protein
LMATEIGGGNGLAPFLAGALLGLPVVDADGMGRAFPLADQVSYAIHGRSSLPTVAAGEHGEVVVVEQATNRQAERLVRAICVVLGSKCFSADYPLSGRDVAECAVLHTASLAKQIGRTIRRTRRHEHDPIESLAQLLLSTRELELRVLYEGKVTACRHEVRDGWGIGSLELQATSGAAPPMTIDFQNEFLVARVGPQPIVTTPDIITIVDSSTLHAISSDGIRYGQRVKVIGIQSPRLMTSARALEVVGPRAFGYEMDYRPLSELA